MPSRKVIAVLLLVIPISSCSADESPCVREPVTIEEGLVYEDLVCGEGLEAGRGDRLTVEYTASLADGTPIESSSDLGEPVSFRLGSGMVIQGWDDGLPGMREDGTRRLTVPPELAYWDSGLPPDIPPDATLVFEIELLEVEPA